MTTFDFTPRHAMFVKKFIEAYGDDFKKDFNEKCKMTSDKFYEKEIDSNDDCIFKIRHFDSLNIRIVINFEIIYHWTDDEDENKIDMGTLEPVINVFYKDFRNSIDQRLALRCAFNEDGDWTEYDWVDSLIKTYTMCSCGTQLIEIKGFCKDCYIWTTEQEDDCCCCRENEGVWIKLQCNHLIHYDCWKKIKETKSQEHSGLCRKCPLCRGETEVNKYYRV